MLYYKIIYRNLYSGYNNDLSLLLIITFSRSILLRIDNRKNIINK